MKKSDRQQTSDDWTEFVNSKKKIKKNSTHNTPDTSNARQVRFVRLLAEYMAKDQVEKSMILALSWNRRNREALEWSVLRNATPLFGYPTVDEAEEELTRFLKGL